VLAAAVVATVSGGSIGGIVCGGASVRSLVGVEGVLGIPIAVHATCLSHSHGIRRPSIGGSFCVQASVRGLIGAGGVPAAGSGIIGNSGGGGSSSGSAALAAVAEVGSQLRL